MAVGVGGSGGRYGGVCFITHVLNVGEGSVKMRRLVSVCLWLETCLGFLLLPLLLLLR